MQYTINAHIATSVYATMNTAFCQKAAKIAIGYFRGRFYASILSGSKFRTNVNHKFFKWIIGRAHTRLMYVLSDYMSFEKVNKSTDYVRLIRCK